MGPETLLRLRADAAPADLQRSAHLMLDRSFQSWRATPDECRQVLERLAQGGPATAGSLAAAFPPERRWGVECALAWLCKLGLLDWLEGEAPDEAGA